MPPKLPRSLPRSTRILGAIGALAMASTGEMEIIYIVVFLLFYMLGYKIEKHQNLQNAMKYIQPTLALFIFLLGIFDFFFISNSFLLSAANFLLLLQGLRLLSLPTTRDNLGGILLSSLMILSASTLAVEWTFFVMLFLFLPAIIWALIIHNLVAENQMVMKSTSEEDKELFDENIRGRMGLLREKSLYWIRMISSLRAASFIAFFVAIICCAVVFIIFPRFNFQGFRGSFLQPVHKTAFTKQVDLAGETQIFEDNSIIMRVSIDPDDRHKWNGYIRGSVLEDFDGKTWKPTPKPAERIYRLGFQEIFLPNYNQAPPEDVLKQEVYLESMESPILFSVNKPFMFRIDRPFLLWSEDGTVRRPFGDSWRLHYVVESAIRIPFEKDRKKSFESKISRESFDSLPANLLSLGSRPLEKVKDLTDDIIGNEQSKIKIAERISNHLSSQYEYSLKSGVWTSDRPIHEFLFEKKVGHCEYFASAMCVMLRMNGIPSRLVTGFYSNEWNERGHYLVFRSKHAHSWVEAFIEPYGWVEFDPSPLVSQGSSVKAPWLVRLLEIKDYLNLRWNRYILSYDWERQVAIGRAVVDRSRLISGRLDRWTTNFSDAFKWYKARIFSPDIENLSTQIEKPKVKGIMAFLIVLILAMTGGLLFWKQNQISKVWFYPALLKLLEKWGGQKPITQTFNEYVSTFRHKLGAKKDDVDYLTSVYLRLRFEPGFTLTEQEKTSVHIHLRNLKNPS